MRTFFAIVAFASSALAYSITGPTNATGWTTTGPNVVSWTMVSSDPANFTIVLSNQSKFPPTQQVLNALVVGNLGTITAQPPSEGWATGTGFQVNFVANSENLNTILAQSQQFTIKTPTSSSISGSLSGTTFVASNTVPVVSSTPAASSGASDLNPSATNTPAATGKSGAAALTISSGLFALTALVGSFLA